jgi:hypothetical protein
LRTILGAVGLCRLFLIEPWEHDPETVIDGNVIFRDQSTSDAEDQVIATLEMLLDSVVRFYLWITRHHHAEPHARSILLS